MASLLKKLYAPRMFDGLFAVAGLIGFGGLIPGLGNDYLFAVSTDDPLTKGGALIGIILLSGLLAVWASRIDQKLADDFVFAMIMKSSFIAFYMVFFALVAWEAILTPSLGSLPLLVAICVMVAAWSLSYFYIRLRGTTGSA